MKRSTRRATGSSTSVDIVALAECVDRFAEKRVVVLGDFVADEFQFGEISRVSREAPVLILRHRETRIVPGGGANATNNFAALGAKVTPISAVGEDSAGEALLAYFKGKGVDVSAVQRAKGWTTPTKTRFLAGWTHTVGQQVLRVDREPQNEVPDSVRRKMEASLLARIRTADAVAVSDYGFGIATPAGAKLMRARRGPALPVTLDARYHLSRYARCGITAATPNEAELEALHHAVIGDDGSALERFGVATRAALNVAALLVTRGKHGMALFEKGRGTVHIPVHGSDQAVDVTGAGDTVLAAFTLGLASGATLLEAAHIANIAGGLVVMKRGTATVSREELLDAIRRETGGAAS